MGSGVRMEPVARMAGVAKVDKRSHSKDEESRQEAEGFPFFPCLALHPGTHPQFHETEHLRTQFIEQRQKEPQQNMGRRDCQEMFFGGSFRSAERCAGSQR